MTSQIHLPKEGGWSLFQFKRMSRRAKRDEKAILINCGFCRGRSSAGRPKSPMKGQGSIVKPEIAEYTSNIEDQNAVKLEQNQNV